MSRKHTLSLHWHIHKRHGSSSQPSSPSTPTSLHGQLPASPITPVDARPQEKPVPTKEEAKSDAKEVWAKIQSSIRDDWEWPNPPESIQPIDNSRHYEEREISTTRPSSPVDGITIHMPTTPQSRSTLKETTRRSMLDEMQWNEGLRTYVERRNAWTGGVEVIMPAGLTRTHSNVQHAVQNQKTMLDNFERESKPEPITRTSSTISSGQSPIPRPKTQTWVSEDTQLQDFTSAKSSLEGSEDSQSENEPLLETEPDINPVTNDRAIELVPHYHPTLPEDHYISQQLKDPAGEIKIYQNLVVEGKPPIVPIPLSSVIKACVAGLKAS
jgi:hypothetical protein